MAFMTWNDEFSVGVVQFDEEYKKLVDMINELYGSICAGSTRETLDRFADALIEHTVEHFAHEERYLDDVQYPRAAQHRSMHEHIKKRVLEFRSDIDSKDSTVLAFEMLQFLRETLAHHINGEDKKYGAYLNTKGIT